MVERVVVIQHGEKHREPGDPGLTSLGHQQAATTARWLTSTAQPSTIWSSPMRRALETAAPIARVLGLDVVVEPRLRERMNWDGPEHQALDEFLVEWRRASTDRAYQPSSGDSSAAAGARFLAALDDLAAARANGVAALVSHGGATTDVLRTLLGDDELRARAPTLLDGVPSCAATTLDRVGDGWSVVSIAATDHLAGPSTHRPA